MSTDPQLFRINSDSKESEKIKEVEFADLGFKERQDIQEWVANNPNILGENLLVIGKEFSGFDRTNERLDLLAIDADGTLVVIELKRDHSGTDTHWQAIKYASYFRQAKQDDIVRMLAEYRKESEDDALSELLQHIGADDLGALNNDQRVILASHRFAPEVTSAALWLNEKVDDENLITCIQLTPYQDGDALYVQSNTIIPLPRTDDYAVGISESPQETYGEQSGNFASKLKKTFDRNRNDEVTRFCKESLRELVLINLLPGVKPDINSRWAGGHPQWRYYHFWYSTQPPWGNWELFYRVNFMPKTEDNKTYWLANIGIECIVAHAKSKFDISETEMQNLANMLEVINVCEGQRFSRDAKVLSLTVYSRSDVLDQNFAEEIASILKQFIEKITPEVEEFENSRNAEPAT